MISRIVIATLAVAHGLQETQATVNAYATSLETKERPSGKSSVMRREMLTQVATLTAEGVVRNVRRKNIQDVHIVRDENDLQDASPSTSELAALGDSEIVGEIGLTLSPGKQGFAIDTANQLAVCEGIVGIVFAAEVPVPDCKITRYLQDSDTDARFQFNIAMPDNDKTKDMLENADMQKVAGDINAGVQQRHGPSFTSSITFTNPIAVHDQKHYVGVRGALVLSAQCTDPTQCEADLMDIMSNTEVHDTARKAIADVCQVQPTEVVVVINDGSAFLQQDQKRASEDEDLSQDLIMKGTFYIHSEQAWELRKLIGNADTAQIATEINNAIVAEYSLQSTMTSFSVDAFHADRITADEAAAMPPPSDPWGSGDASADEVGRIGGWLNFSTDEYDQFYDQADAQMAIQCTLADVGYIGQEEITLNMHRVPELGDIQQLTKFNQDDIETVAVQWTAALQKKYIRTVIAKFEKTTNADIAAKITQKMQDKLLTANQLTVLGLTCA